jgi:hypothetical protein
MASSIQLLRSNIGQERPFPGILLDGQPAINTNAGEPGFFFKTSDGALVKVGPAAITSDGNPPNFSAVGHIGNTVGELWLDKSGTSPVLKVFDGQSWVTIGGGGSSAPVSLGELNDVSLISPLTQNQNLSYNGTIWTNQFGSDYLDVRNFGAVGDGIADDSLAIQAAVDFANARGGGTVICRAARLLRNSVAIKSNVTLDLTGANLIVPSQGPGRVPAGSVTVGSETITYASGHAFFYAIGQQNFKVVGGAGIVDDSAQTNWQAATRTFDIIGCKDYSISGVKAFANGAFVANRYCFNYIIENNDIECKATDNQSHHDGVIDQWWGSSNFLIKGNTIEGNGIALWPILATGTDSFGTKGTPMRDFIISENIVRNSKNPAIWTMGREGITSDFQIINNVISGVSQRSGIEITESDNFVVSGNVISDTFFSSIRVFDEVGTATQYSGKNGIVSGNTCKNANLGNATSSYVGAAIVIAGISENIDVSSNIVQGTTHVYAVACIQSPSRIFISNGVYSPGTLGTVFASSTNNITNSYPSGVNWPSNPAPVSGCSSTVNQRGSTVRRADKYVEADGVTRVVVTAPIGNAVTFLISPPDTVSFTSAYDVIGTATTVTGDVVCGVYASGPQIIISFISRGAETLDLRWSFNYVRP